MFRNLRSVFSVRRLPLRAEAYLAQNAATHNVRRVRFIKPFFTRHRALRLFLYTAPVVGFWRYVLPRVLPEIDDEDEEAMEEGEGNKQHMEDGEETSDVLVPDVPDENATFIPLGWARRLPPKPYKGSDPEWQEFLKFSKDPSRTVKLRKELAEMVKQVVSARKTFQQLCGTPLEVRRCWLDIEYPTVAPPEYERSGIEITDDYVAWVSRPVDSRNYFRLQHALRPTAIAQSLWASYTTLWQHNIDKTKEILSLKSQPRQEALRPFGPPMLPQPKSQKLQENRSGLPGHMPPSSTTTEPPSNTSVRGQPSNTSSDSRQETSSSPSSSATQSTKAPSAVQVAFVRTLASTWRPSKKPPSRGIFMVSGLVECVGPQGWVTVDVRAAYNPKTSRWEAVDMGIRRKQRKRQAPVT